MDPNLIPIIDIAPLKALDCLEYDQQDLAAVLSGIHQSLSQIGFMYIKGHGISQNLIDEIYEISKEFFKLSEEEKMKISMTKSGRQWRGYFPLGGELTSGIPDKKEGIYFGSEHPDDHPGVVERWMMHGKNQYLNERFRILISEYLDQLTQVAQRLMKAISLSLGLELDYFKKRGFTVDPTILFRIFNYPKHIWDGDQWGVREHTDYGFLTLLNQDESGGLQVKLKSGEWIQAPPIKGTFVINIGDMLELWTHGIYKATPHRVQNQGNGDRLSLPFFFDPNWKCTLEPIDVNLLSKEDLESVHSDDRHKRWDGIDIQHLSSEMTYGQQLQSKVEKCFPDLAQM